MELEFSLLQQDREKVVCQRLWGIIAVSCHWFAQKAFNENATAISMDGMYFLGAGIILVIIQTISAEQQRKTVYSAA